MNLFEFSFLADENVHPEVVAYLRNEGLVVKSASQANLISQSDTAVLQFAHLNNLVVLTHDSDFGTLAIARQEPIIGILFLRPGHIKSEFTIATLNALMNNQIEVTAPFIVTAVRKGQTVRTRIRKLQK